MTNVSIVIPAYNAQDYILPTLQSIANQTHKDFECIVVNDGSTDNTADIVEQFNDKRFRCVSIKNSGGPARPRNVGIEQAEGEFIFLFDSDDLMVPDKIEKTLHCFEQFPQAMLVCTNFSTIDETGNLVSDNYLEKYGNLWSLVSTQPRVASRIASDDAFTSLLKRNYIGTSSVALKKSLVTEQGLRFDERLKNSDDRLFWHEVTALADICFLNEVLHQYRLRKGNITSRGIMGRGESKLIAFDRIMQLCKTEYQRGLVRKIVSVDAASMAWGYRKEKSFTKSIELAKRSLKEKPNWFAFKTLILSSLSKAVQ